MAALGLAGCADGVLPTGVPHDGAQYPPPFGWHFKTEFLDN